jgi:CHAT domain-containing protein/tetratricopeptide (TPR) repeat protein
MPNHPHFLRLCFVLFAAVIACPWANAQDEAAPPAVSEKLQTTIRVEQQMRRLFAESKYADALPLAKESVALWEEMEGSDSKPVANMLLWQGQIEGQLARYDDAEKSYGRALKINTALFGLDHHELIGCLAGQASITQDRGKFAEAEALYRRIIALYEKSPNPDPANHARAVDNLGVALLSMGKIDEAEAVHRRAIPLMERAIGATHPDYAIGLQNLAEVYMRQAKYAEAITLFKQALAIKLQTYSTEHLDLTTTLTSLAIALGNLQRFEEAEQIEQSALAIRRKSLPADHPEIGKSYNILGTFSYDVEKYAASEELYRRALAIYEKALPGHAFEASVVQNLANALNAQGKYLEAQKLYDRALEIEIKALGEDHPDVAGTLYNYSSTLMRLEQYPQAADAIDRERRTHCRHIARVLPGLSPKQQLIYLSLTEYDRRAKTFSFGLHQQNNPQFAALSASWLLNGKALAQEALTQNSLLLRGNNDPEVAAESAKLFEVRRRLANLVLGTSESPAGAHRPHQIEQLEAQERELTEALAAKIGRAVGSGRWFEIADLRAAIPVGSVLVDIAHFFPFDFDAKLGTYPWKAKRYVAWIIPPAGQGDVKIVDLGEAEPIDDAVKAVQKEINAAQRVPLNKEDDVKSAEQSAKHSLAKLANLIWNPLAGALPDDAKNLLLSPDGALWLTPWAALPIDDTKYLVEKFSLRYLVSGRDLLAEKSTDKTPTHPIIFADPNFDLDQNGVDSATRAVLRGTRSANKIATRSIGPKRSSTILPRVVRLKGTAEEAVAIKPALAEYARNPPLAYLDHYATEGIFKAIRSPQVLVMSTHGFFLSGQETRSNTESRGLAEPAPAPAVQPTPPAPGFAVDGKPIENPLLRCGLLLAGCNQPAQNRTGQEVEASDDGILTGMEIVGVDLRGTELVVLSACETGLGQVGHGEGVAGLRQAFQLAGAKSVVATLWQIPDQETATLMTAFFKHLAAGESKAEALRSAQLELIGAHRKKYSAAHPYFWAAFTVTGD